MIKVTFSEAQIRDEAHGLYRGSVDGKLAWSDGMMIEIGTDNPFKKLKNVLWSEGKPQFQPIVDGIKRRREFTADKEKLILSKKKLCEITRRPLKQRPLVELTANNAQQIIDQKYYNFFKSRYPDCQFHITKATYAPVAVYDNSILTGIIMPYLALR